MPQDVTFEHWKASVDTALADLRAQAATPPVPAPVVVAPAQVRTNNPADDELDLPGLPPIHGLLAVTIWHGFIVLSAVTGFLSAAGLLDRWTEAGLPIAAILLAADRFRTKGHYDAGRT